MLRTIFISIFLALSVAGVTAQQPPPARLAVQAEPAWTNGAPANAGFTVLMPGKPSEQTQPMEGRPGVEHHLLMVETKLAGFVVSYVVFPEVVTDPADIKVLLDRGREGALSSSGATLKSEKEIKLNDYFGREWLMDFPSGFSATARAYWVKRRLLQAIFVIAPKSDDSPEIKRLRQEAATKFFDSFRLSDDAR